MNNKQLSRIVLKGFKSIRECDLELSELNLLIGPNGAGKSNFIEKVLHGPLIALDVGLDTIRRECPIFHEWVNWLESLAVRGEE